MSVTQHRAAGHGPVGCAVLTISDTRTPETDTGGRTAIELLQAAGHLVREYALVPDDAVRVRQTVGTWTQRAEIAAIITTGGTGIAARDRTYDALARSFEPTLPGFGELFRHVSFQQIGAAAMLSRAAAGVIDGRIVFMLPGAPAAVHLALTTLIVPELGHIVAELSR